MDRGTHFLERAAPTDICDLGVDFGISRIGLALEEGSDRHDHAALTIAALRHVVIDPGLLHLVECAFGGEALDGDNLLAGGVARGNAAGAHRNAVQMHGAGAAQRDAAAIFRTREAHVLADRPEQWRIRFDVDVMHFAIDCETHDWFLRWIIGLPNAEFWTRPATVSNQQTARCANAEC